MTFADLRAAYPELPEVQVRELLLYRDGAHPYPFERFLTAVLANDLFTAARVADGTNRRLLATYAQFVVAVIPSTARGSYDAVQLALMAQNDSSVTAPAEPWRVALEVAT
ncbi:MAG: hypothetical protein C0497_06020 [Gemmatimonas sp.]|nr:hypothetical protein [Gemmatimonas sp.]